MDNKYRQALNIEGLSTREKLVVLLLVYHKLCDLLEIYCTGPRVIDSQMNFYYSIFCKLVKKIVKTKEFVDINPPEYIDDLMGDEDIEIIWLYYERKNIYKNLGKIDNLYKLEDFEKVPVPQIIITLINEYKEYATSYLSMKKKCEKNDFKKALRIKQKMFNEPGYSKMKVRLDNKDYFLEINDGEKVIPFKSNKQTSSDDKAKLQYKILRWFFEYGTWVYRNGKLIKRNKEEQDIMSLDHLRQKFRCPSVGAVQKHIYRINKIFKNEKVPLEIVGKNNQYRLIIGNINTQVRIVSRLNYRQKVK